MRSDRSKVPAATDADDPSAVRQEQVAERSGLFVGSVDKAFRVLEAFGASHGYMSIAEIARAAALDRSATQRLVHTLEQLGYVRRVPDSTLYGLSPKILGFSYSYLHAKELVQRASAHLLELSRSLGETANLHELDGLDVVYLARFPGRHLLNVDFAVGFRLPAVYTASGTAILSKMPEAHARRVVEATPPTAVTPFTETAADALIQRIRLAATLGYSIVQNQTLVGDISVAAAILGQGGIPIGAINVSVPTTRWTLEAAEERLAPHVQLVASAITQLGCRR